MNTTDEMRRKAVDLSLIGLTQVEIAARLGVTQPRVSQLLAEGRQEWRQETARSYEEHVEMQLARLEMLMRKLEAGLDAGDPRSVDSALKLVDRIAKILGLDHRDRMSERTVQVEEAKIRIVGAAVAAMLDHLGVAGPARLEALEVLQHELERAQDA